MMIPMMMIAMMIAMMKIKKYRHVVGSANEAQGFGIRCDEKVYQMSKKLLSNAYRAP